MDELSELHLSHTPISFSEVTGKGKTRSRSTACRWPRRPNIPPRMPMSTLRLALVLKPKLQEAGKRGVYETLERPLVMVLADMERAGVMIDPDMRGSSPTISPSSRAPWKPRSTSWRAAPSISARPSSWAKSCSTA